MNKFLENVVNQRFINIYNLLESKHIIRGKSDIAKQLNTYNHVINSILKGQRNLTVDQIEQLCSKFHVDANYLFGRDVPPFLAHADHADLLPAHTQNSDFSGRTNIKLIPQQALAGYALAFQDPTYYSELPRFGIPGLEGNLLAFPVSGDSMLPTITSGDIVVCEALEKAMDQSFPKVRDNEIYVIVSDVVVVKRIQKIKVDGEIVQLRLISDNKAVYQAYEVDLEEVKQILRVKCRLTNHAIS